jgi:D-sedoheptulose 7-phosphate isomerase
MDLTARVTAHMRDAIALHEHALDVLPVLTATAIEAIFFAIANDGKVLACGNGASAADAQRFVSHLVGRFERERMPLAAIALTADPTILTGVSNDLGYDRVFSQQIHALGHPGDVLVVLSASGNSPSVLQAVVAAHERDMRVIALTGQGGGDVAALLTEDDIHLAVPHDRTPRIQEIHLLLLHALCDGMDAQLLGEA